MEAAILGERTDVEETEYVHRFVGDRAATIVDVLQRRARHSAGDVALTFLRNGIDDVVSWTYADLAQRASSIAAAFTEIGIAGKRVVLLYEPGLEYVAAFFAVLQAGAIAVPSFTPAGTRGFERIVAIINDATPDVILSTGRMRAAVDRLRQRGKAGDFHWIATDELTSPAAIEFSSAASTQALALLQYTSGSTGNPKGVMIDHANLMSNCATLAQWMGPVNGWMGCTWLPPYHDMGLMGGILQPIYAGFPVVILAPAHFVQNPARWLRAITQYRVTTTVAPNFALDLCSTSIGDDELEEIDLSSLNNVFCGAEPIRVSTLQNFYRRFARCGFRYEAFNPCYGLAEATLFVSGKPANTAPTGCCLDQQALDANRVSEIAMDNSRARVLIGCGTVAERHQLRIVDPLSLQPIDAEHIGEIWVAGPNVAQGYWQREPETRASFGAVLSGDDDRTYLRTGDLGFMRDGELFVTGRLKDVIIIAGRNHYPQDIELTAQNAHTDLRTNGVVAFGIDSEQGEALVIVAEVRRFSKRSPVDVGAVREAIVREVAAMHGVRPQAVHVGSVGTVPTTTSGKVQRRLCRQMYLNATLPVLPALSAKEELRHVDA
ncbi:MAG: fatty acyl-AMP ligase [Gammaproteobacteria bacterium]|nr:fatty acyl-AMP ligase [Gammaproteobacteria bacterium]